MTCQQQLQGQGAQLVDPLALGADDHAVLCLEQAGLNHALLPFHLHDAHPAGPVFRQVRMVAQVGDVDPGFQGAFQHVLVVGHVQRDPVDGDHSHWGLLPPSEFCRARFCCVAQRYACQFCRLNSGG